MTDIEEYWACKEAEIGETVDAKFYCKYLSGDLLVKGPLLGVLFFSNSTLFFQSFSSPKYLESLVRMRRQEDLTESHAFKLPLENLKCAFKESPKNFLRKLFAEPEQSLVIHFTDGKQNTRTYRFSVEWKEVETIVNLINRKNLKL